MKKRDIIIIVAVLVVALASIPVVRYFQAQRTAPEDFVYVYVGSDLYEAAPLDEAKTIHVERTDDEGVTHINDILITEDGKVSMLDSTCENQDCVYQGVMSPENYEERPMRNWIVCLPNQISIELRLAEDAK